MHDYTAPDMTQGGTVTIPSDPPEMHILIEGNEEPGSVHVTASEAHGGCLWRLKEDWVCEEGGTGAVSTGPVRISRDELFTEVVQVDANGVKCAHDSWHNVIAFSGVGTLLLVILIAVAVTNITYKEKL